MARKTFISYKFSEAQDLRNDILEALGDDATYYRGETADSPDLTDRKTETIKYNLTKMMYDTSVTIVIISPNMTASKWIDWEIEYSLKEISREGRVSKTNGVVGVIKKVDGSYGWLIGESRKACGCTLRTFNNSKLYTIIKDNRQNLKSKVYVCDKCQSLSALTGSYISLIEEETFLSNPYRFIENAYEKSEKASEFYLCKQR